MPDPEKLWTSVQYLKGVGPQRAAHLGRLGIQTLYDLLGHYPERYFDRRTMVPLARIVPGAPVTVQGAVTSISSSRTSRKRMPILEVGLTDGEGRAVLVWFNQPFREKEFRIGDTVIASGKVQAGRAVIMVEEYEILGEGQEPLHAAGLVPSYPATEGFGKRPIRSLVRAAVEEFLPVVPETIPAEVRSRRRLPGVREALRHIHMPETPEEAAAARRRFAYEEFFTLQVHLALRRRSVRLETAGTPLPVGEALDFRIRALFPFKLTGAQDRAIDQIRRDLSSGRPMNRLLQGDVGSGKTIVAAYALLAAVGYRAQAALMAPTEVLAEQHARTFRRLLEKSRVRIAFLGGGARTKEREALLASIASGESGLVIGTHALLEGDVRFRKLALAVIDEQQKFGVLQREALGRKGDRPHRLVMTATPIPRTLALTLYGDLDLSVIDEMPPGRREIRTFHVPPGGRRSKIEFIKDRLREGRQAYFVYPLVDDSDRVALRSAMKMHAELLKEFRGFRVALLHGRMKPEEKDAVMEEFRSGKAHVLVSTIVIEVGIDVPNASVMVIDNCERYGLSQLHQLRGRIGRGPHESYCMLFGERNERIDAFVATNDGFQIAESDFRLRGPGDVLGTRQSGIPGFRAADLLNDLGLLEQAREDAFGWVEKDPSLAGAPGLRQFLRNRPMASSLMTVG
jgi:ATP-dependent DNA helicase RecG